MFEFEVDRPDAKVSRDETEHPVVGPLPPAVTATALPILRIHDVPLREGKIPLKKSLLDRRFRVLLVVKWARHLGSDSGKDGITTSP
jgi:hypothetical protein